MIITIIVLIVAKVPLFRICLGSSNLQEHKFKQCLQGTINSIYLCSLHTKSKFHYFLLPFTKKKEQFVPLITLTQIHFKFLHFRNTYFSCKKTSIRSQPNYLASIGIIAKLLISFQFLDTHGYTISKMRTFGMKTTEGTIASHDKQTIFLGTKKCFIWKLRCYKVFDPNTFSTLIHFFYKKFDLYVKF